jgi:hypothetical protein
MPLHPPSINIVNPRDGENVPVNQPLYVSGNASGRGVTVWLGNDAPVKAKEHGAGWYVNLTPTKPGPTTVSARSKGWIYPWADKTQTVSVHVT